MKKWFTIAASMIAAVSVLSCTKIFPGDDDPKVPITGDEESNNPSEGDDNLVFNCPEAYGCFYGQYYDVNGNLIDYDSYSVEFDTEGISFDESTGYTGTGYVAFIDIDTEHTASIAIPDGIYSSDADPDGGFYAYPGESGTYDDGTEYLNPAYIVKLVNSEYEIILAEKVKLTVSSSASNYVLKAELTDAAKNVYVFNYNGPLEIGDYSGPDEEDPGTDNPGTDVPGDGDIVNLSADGYKYGYAVYYGQDWKIESTDYADWVLYVSETEFDFNDDEFFSSEDYAMIEVLTGKSATTAVPAGTYTCMTTGDESEFVPGALIYGMTDNYGYPTYGTWFYQGDDWACVTGGSIVVKSVNGTAYTIDVNLVDEDHGYSVTGSFTANLEYIDAAVSAAQARKAKISLSKKTLVKKFQNNKKAAASHPTKSVRDNKFRPRFAK